MSAARVFLRTHNQSFQPTSGSSLRSSPAAAELHRWASLEMLDSVNLKTSEPEPREKQNGSVGCGERIGTASDRIGTASDRKRCASEALCQ